jgi:hypothetical protein
MARFPHILWIWVAALGVAAVSTAVSDSWGAFSAQTQNPGNSFQAAAEFVGPLRIATGSYTGDATDDRAITGVGFQPDVVIIKSNSVQGAIMRTSTMSGDAAKRMVGASALGANLIQSLDSNGFTIGTELAVNAVLTTYWWIALQAGDYALKVGSYAGNGTSQSISGLGFSPEYVMVASSGGAWSVQRFSGMSTSYQFDADLGASDRITSLDGNGFSVGSSAQVNENLTAYHWVAWNQVAGSIKMGSYAGNDTDNRDITGVGFQPDYVIVRGDDTLVARRGVHRPASMTGTTDCLTWDPVSTATSAIKALQSDGFQVGTGGAANAGGTTYHYLAMRNTP